MTSLTMKRSPNGIEGGSEEEDDDLKLSAHAAAALAEFLADQHNDVTEADSLETEDWQLSQFWYDEETTERLVQECLATTADGAHIACVSCPTLFNALISPRHRVARGVRKVALLEFDRRFERYNDTAGLIEPQSSQSPHALRDVNTLDSSSQCNHKQSPTHALRDGDTLDSSAQLHSKDTPSTDVCPPALSPAASPPSFIFYDYNTPLALGDLMPHTFDLVVADPPFLADECLTKVAQTVRHLVKPRADGGRTLLCTGRVMAETARRVLDVELVEGFEPRHRNNLANEFSCFADYATVTL